MNIFQKMLVKSFLKFNAKTINETAIKNCHVEGLHSFILAKFPFKIRLFVADKSCQLRLPYDVKNPSLTIHKHKHFDLFLPLTKCKIMHHMYKLTEEYNDNTLSFSLNEYPRLNQSNMFSGKCGGSELLDYVTSDYRMYMTTDEYHSVSIIGTSVCAWLVVELTTNEEFESYSYGGHKLSSNCYQKIESPIKFIEKLLF